MWPVPHTPASSTFKKRPRLYLQCIRKLLKHVKADGVPSALNRADIGTVDACQVGERLLREASLKAKLLQVPCQHIPKRHAGDLKPLSTFQPRSILYNVLRAPYRGALSGGYQLIHVRWAASKSMAAAMVLARVHSQRGGPL
jgi:hypothetical protein